MKKGMSWCEKNLMNQNARWNSEIYFKNILQIDRINLGTSPWSKFHWLTK